MAQDAIYPVILCGGSGTRLWPLSRESYPKQFAAIDGEQTLLQLAATRFAGEGFNKPVAVTTNAFRFAVVQQLQSVGIDPGAVLLEPAPKNTAPAALAAALYVSSLEPDALVLITPSDHLIPDPALFRTSVFAGSARAKAGDIVTFGAHPDRAETGYGYLKAVTTEPCTATDLLAFVEKPPPAVAKEFVSSGQYLWNTGVFLARADTLVSAFKALIPDLFAPVKVAFDTASQDLGFLRLESEAWKAAPAISFDYAIMEKASNVAVVPFGGEWSDLGSWSGVWSVTEAGADGVVEQGSTTSIDCSDSLLRSEDEALHVVGIGLDNTIVVAMPDAVLVASKSRVQDVRYAIEQLKDKGLSQATEPAREHRPWGWFETVSLAPRYRVKKIVVYPGASLSLQSHVHRAEHWIVVVGSAQVTVGDKTQLVSENQSIYVPLGMAHRLENPGKVPLHLIEVQTGTYLGEDDVIRYEDAYRRNAAE